MAVLSRMMPETSVQLTPALAQFAKSPGAREELTGILAENPHLKKPLLVALAADPDNAGLILDLAGPDGRSTDRQSRSWQFRLLRGLIARGDYERAYELWRRFDGAAGGPRPLLYNGEFKRLPSLPPFNWEFPSSGAGVAEPGNGGLSVLYYGREDSILASQLLLLPRGNYRFQAPVQGRLTPGALAWSVLCLPRRESIMDIVVREGGAAATLAVPATGCGAQLLQLRGIRQDMPQDSEVQIGPARIERVGA
jgi:hypothetical protein